MKDAAAKGQDACVSATAARIKGRRSMSFSQVVVGGLVVMTDAVAAIGSGLVIYLFYLGWSLETYSDYLVALCVSTVVMLGVFRVVGLYEIDAIYRPLRQIRKILSVSCVLFFMLVATAFALKISVHYSRVWSFTWLSVLPGAICMGRGCVYSGLSRWVRNGRLVENIAIVGGEAQGLRLLRHLELQKEPWVHVVGIFDDRLKRLPASPDILGTLDDLVRFAQQHRLDDVLVALPWSAEARVVDIVHKLKVLPAHIRLCPDAVAFCFLNRTYSRYSGIPTLNVQKKPMADWGTLLKSFEDRVLTALIMIPVLPIMLVVAAAIKLDSPGPVFFRQKRYGFNNQLIEVLKFRSMYVDQQDDNAEKLATRDDPRVTRIGKFLRRTSLDELPQLFNVLKGEMSLVGPRPHALQAKAAGKLYQELVREYAVRHKVKPGITGWAQARGWRGETDTEEKIQKRVEHDIFYIEHWSLQFDIYILLLTLWGSLRRRNAY